MKTLKINKAVFFLLSFTYFFCSCDNGDESISFQNSVEIDDFFEESMDNWSGDFADYGVGREVDFNLNFERTNLPEPLNSDQYALKLSGMNGSDDLFMYLKKKVTGLKPDTRSNVLFDIEFASNVADGLVGIGGSRVNRFS